MTPNPFFGNRIPKKVPISIKEDFNPFKQSKVVSAKDVRMYPLHFFLFCYFVLMGCTLLDQDWPYTGTRYMAGFAPRSQPQQRQPQSSPHMVPHGPPPIPPPPAEYQEDPAAQAARGYMYAYQPYAYPGQMIPGMPPPPPGYMPGPYMQPMPYPMPPPGGTFEMNLPCKES